MLRVTLTANPSNLESALMAKQAVWSALDVLPPRRRAIVVLHELEGMDLSSVASFLGLRAITVRWHLSMARRDLKRLLTSHTGDIG
jgi:DNA-directed RNA polymerase specialized sigma24 family protein